MKNILIPILLFCCFPSFSQPVLTAANYNFVAGDVSYSHHCDTSGITIDAGGASHVWNYGTLAVTKTDTQSVVSCSSTPYWDSFSTANVALQLSPANIAYGFTSTAFSISIGSYSDQVGYIYILRPDTMKFPISYPMSWNDTSLEVYDTTYASSHLFKEGKSIVDGYGTLILPSGTFTNVLRVHQVVFLTDSNYTGGSLAVYHYRTDQYSWYVPGYHFPLLFMEVDNDVVSGAIQDIFYIAYSSGPGIAKLSLVRDQRPELSIYPNPVNDLIHVDAIQGSLGYRLMNMVGKVIDVGNLNNGKNVIDVQNVESGVYMLEVSNREGEKTINKIIKQ